MTVTSGAFPWALVRPVDSSVDIGPLGLGAVPGDRALEPFPERRSRSEADERLSTRGVELAAGLPVRLRRVPAQLAREPRQVGNERGQFADRDLLAAPDVHRLR